MSEGKMYAISVRATGGPEVLEYLEIDVPEPGSGEVAVQVGAAGVNFIDIYHRQGVYPMPLPLVPGREGAGRVIALGPDVSGVAIGDRVRLSIDPELAYVLPSSESAASSSAVQELEVA